MEASFAALGKLVDFFFVSLLFVSLSIGINGLFGNTNIPKRGVTKVGRFFFF